MTSPRSLDRPRWRRSIICPTRGSPAMLWRCARTSSRLCDRACSRPVPLKEVLLGSEAVACCASAERSRAGAAGGAAEAAPAALPPYPILARPSAGGLLTGAVFRRRTRGGFDECCRKSCSISELQTYCGRR
uniref:Insulin-like peptide 2 ILP2 n=1 Tax=Locusta migratoria TaxID=7004 RepID=A0A6G9W3E6_LOCMI|nr:insulin-like peptide 2 ILP2 [Locusta migratoria]